MQVGNEGNHQNSESDAAYRREHDTLKRLVFAAIEAAGDAGLTADELAAQWRVRIQAIASRFGSLQREGRITKIGKRIDTRAVAYVAVTV